MVLRSECRMVGHTGFHARPGEKSLDAYAPGGVEFGYRVFETTAIDHSAIPPR